MAAAGDEWKVAAELGLCDPELAELAKRGNFTRDGAAVVEYTIFATPSATRHVLLLTGWDESFIKYAEVIRRLVDAGCAVYTMDHRGQGLSSREIPDQQITYVREFDDYVLDARHFLEVIVRPPQPVCVVAHSMGGLVASLLAIYVGSDGSADCVSEGAALALSNGNGGSGGNGSGEGVVVVDRLVLCSPMFLMKPGMPLWAALLLARVGCWLGLGPCYAPGQGPISHLAPLTNKLTNDRSKLEQMHLSRARWPQLAKGGMSFGWVRASTAAQLWFWRNMHRVRNAVLLVHAEDDSFVNNVAFTEFYARAPHCRKVMYHGTYHEVFMERSAPRNHALDAMIAHIMGDKPLPREEHTVQLAALPGRSNATAFAAVAAAVATVAAAAVVVLSGGGGDWRRGLGRYVGSG